LTQSHLVNDLFEYFNITKTAIMKKKINHPDRDEAFVSGAYSDGLLIDGYVYVSGQASIDFKSSQFMLGTIEDETKRTLNNIKAILSAAGASMDDVIKCTVHLADISDFNVFNQIYATYFNGIKPARTTVQSVLAENIKVEIDCIAKLP